MSNKIKLQAAINKATRAAQKANQERETVRELFIERYGVDYSDCDCDPIIDCVDYGQSDPVKVDEVDGFMRETGKSNQQTEGE